MHINIDFNLQAYIMQKKHLERSIFFFIFATIWYKFLMTHLKKRQTRGLGIFLTQLASRLYIRPTFSIDSFLLPVEMLAV